MCEHVTMKEGERADVAPVLVAGDAGLYRGVSSFG